jgi:excisionase family DNA binding protein
MGKSEIDAIRVPREGLATIDQAAEYLSLSKAMLHKLIAHGFMPARRFGRAVRIPWRWLHLQARDSDAKIECLPAGPQMGGKPETSQSRPLERV